MKQPGEKAFTLIETIAVLAAIALLAGAAFVPMMRRLDEAVRQKEAKELSALAAAYKQSVATYRVIPNETGWASAVSAITGQQLNVITTNDRGLSRIFLIDPALRIGDSTLSTLTYTQSVTGHRFPTVANVARPVSPRLMIVSTVSAALPTNIVSGVGLTFGASSFNSLWNAADGVVPFAWNGRPEDLKIQRIDLSDMFVQVALNNRDSTLVPRYAISTNSDLFVTNTVASGCAPPMYFLKGSEIRLYNALTPAIMEHSEILSQSRSFTFEYGTWEPEAYLASSVGQPSPIDLQKAMNLFMLATSNPNAQGGVTQTTVSNALATYMKEYMLWRDGSPAYSLANGGKAPQTLLDAQTALKNTTSKLINP
jgi:prepilin-type N-terminal cleavage/methylation domain-containing protein